MDVFRTTTLVTMAIAAAWLSTAGAAQRDSYAGQDLGWLKVLDPREPQKPVTIDRRTYSSTQMAISQQVASWMQASYTPRGAVGRALRMVNEKLGPYNTHTDALPQMYGAVTRTYIDLKRDAAGRWTPASNTNWYWQVAINGAIGDYVDVITTPEQYDFYIPGSEGLGPEARKIAILGGFTSHPALRPYDAWYQPKGIRTTLQDVVLLSRNHGRPYVPASKGEYLDQLAKAIARVHAEKLAAGERGATAAYDRRVAALARLRQTYASRLDSPAVVDQEQPDVYLEHRADPFTINPGGGYAIYKFDPAKAALSRQRRAAVGRGVVGSRGRGQRRRAWHAPAPLDPRALRLRLPLRRPVRAREGQGRAVHPARRRLT